MHIPNSTPAMIITCSHHQCLIVADEIKINAGNGCSINASDRCEFVMGADSVINCRNYCDVSIGDGGTITTGNYCSIRAGVDCEISVGPGSIVIAGDGSEIKFNWWLGDQQTQTRVVVGEDHIQPYVPYTLRNGRVEAVN